MAERSFHRYSTSFPVGRGRPTDYVELGPDLPDSLARRLLGDLDGKRVLDLGCGMGHGAIAMAKAGAKVFAIDPDPIQIDATRDLCETEEVVLETHEGDLAGLAFLQPDSFDAVVSVHALAASAELDRAFRQVHRVLKEGSPLVLSLPHPAAKLVDPFDDDPDQVVRPYFGGEALGSGPSLTHPHTIADAFGGLFRANFRVDTLLEPAPADGVLPQCFVMRGRKVGN